MTVHRPVIPEDLALEIEERRGDVPFQRYVASLLREGLKARRSGSSPEPLPTMPDPVKRSALSQTWRR
jgi:hypothetical protein